MKESEAGVLFLLRLITENAENACKHFSRAPLRTLYGHRNSHVSYETKNASQNCLHGSKELVMLLSARIAKIIIRFQFPEVRASVRAPPNPDITASVIEGSGAATHH